MLGMAFVDRYPVRHAIRRKAGREHEWQRPKFDDRLKKPEAAQYVVVIIQDGLDDRFANIGKSCEVHHRIRSMLSQHLQHARPIAGVTDLKGTELHRLAMTARQIIVGDWLVTVLGQHLAGVTADISSAAGDEYFQR